MIVESLARLRRVAQRFQTTGRLRAAPGPIIERFFGGRDCFFVQVGANDGVTGDPLYKLIQANPRWRGIFVEPQAECVAELLAKYGADGRYAVERVAIGESRGEELLYSLSPRGMQETGIPASFNVFASLNREHVLGQIASAMRIYQADLSKDPAAYMLATPVRSEPLMSVLARHGVDHVDLFVVNAESHDYRILRQIDFEKIPPKLILYEHGALSPDDARSVVSLLAQKGYRLANCGTLNTVAVRRGGRYP